ncbi:hypothetical protein ACFP81_14210 [Deinococcus lacus]|uniref:Uncharacterized protein n=1 Tax=Deinococcus lacus TaxID=392561 RepID=A0ABW1YIU5_9DEIO
MREFRTASSLTRLSGSGAVALQDWKAGSLSAQQALEAVRADLLDSYGARLNEALGELGRAQTQNYRATAAEQTALVRGYFQLLAPQYAEQRGEEALAATERLLAGLPQTLPELSADLETFRAAPLSDREVRARTSQAVRFAELVAVEYARGSRTAAARSL